MHVIAIANQKGGCGKTTTAINLSAALGEDGARVLLIDMDPQGHASLGLGQSTLGRAGLFEVLNGQNDLDDVIQDGVAWGVDLVPATISLAAVEHVLSDRPERERQLIKHLETVAHRYDYAILDCPPSLGLLAVNALRAASQVLVPMDASLYALDGLQRLRELVHLIETRYDLDIPLRLLPIMFDTRTRLARSLFDHLLEQGLNTCATRIRACVKIREAALQGQSLLAYAPRAPVAADYRNLALELRSQATAQQRATTLETTTTATPIEAHEIVLNFQDLECRRLQIAGDFNDWIPDGGVETRQLDGSWQKVLHVAEGAYEYRVIIDGIWQQDPTNPYEVPNNLGGNNSLLRV
ncbi:MAG: AAA family ATPase [Gammaproteobacteria bacterium]|nr:AAA family ATPase [Gammaproteobacteria bacterium]